MLRWRTSALLCGMSLPLTLAPRMLQSRSFLTTSTTLSERLRHCPMSNTLKKRFLTLPRMDYVLIVRCGALQYMSYGTVSIPRWFRYGRLSHMTRKRSSFKLLMCYLFRCFMEYLFHYRLIPQRLGGHIRSSMSSRTPTLEMLEDLLESKMRIAITFCSGSAHTCTCQQVLHFTC